MFMDFVGVCMDEIVNQAAKNRYMFGGQADFPVTYRCSTGGGMNLASFSYGSALIANSTMTTTNNQ